MTDRYIHLGCNGNGNVSVFAARPVYSEKYDAWVTQNNETGMKLLGVLSTETAKLLGMRPGHLLRLRVCDES